MKVLILEDEMRAARQIKKMLTRLLPNKNLELIIHTELDEAQAFLKKSSIELLILDLNLHGEDGFEILKDFSGESFNTIICSAYREKAFQAFEYGVIDFLSKPIDQDRLKIALTRLEKGHSARQAAKFLVIKKSLSKRIVPLEEVYYLEAQEHHTLIGLEGRENELHHKSLSKLMKVLPPNFERIHRSFVVNTHLMDELKLYEGSKQELLLKNGKRIPIGRTYYPSFKQYFI